MCGESLFELVKMIQVKEKGYKVAILKLVKQFQPLIRKYSYLLNYEDSLSELTLNFIETLYKIPIDNPRFKQDKYIISYINRSIRNGYIRFSQKRNKLYYYEPTINLDIIKDSYQINVGDKLYIDELLSLLTEREKEIIHLKYFKEYSDIEISKKVGIPRQAVNSTKNRALTKMKKYALSS